MSEEIFVLQNQDKQVRITKGKGSYKCSSCDKDVLELAQYRRIKKCPGCSAPRRRFWNCACSPVLQWMERGVKCNLCAVKKPKEQKYYWEVSALENKVETKINTTTTTTTRTTATTTRTTATTTTEDAGLGLSKTNEWNKSFEEFVQQSFKDHADRMEKEKIKSVGDKKGLEDIEQEVTLKAEKFYQTLTVFQLDHLFPGCPDEAWTKAVAVSMHLLEGVGLNKEAFLRNWDLVKQLSLYNSPGEIPKKENIEHKERKEKEHKEEKKEKEEQKKEISGDEFEELEELIQDKSKATAVLAKLRRRFSTLINKRDIAEMNLTVLRSSLSDRDETEAKKEGKLKIELSVSQRKVQELEETTKEMTKQIVQLKALLLRLANESESASETKKETSPKRKKKFQKKHEKKEKKMFETLPTLLRELDHRYQITSTNRRFQWSVCSVLESSCSLFPDETPLKTETKTHRPCDCVWIPLPEEQNYVLSLSLFQNLNNAAEQETEEKGEGEETRLSFVSSELVYDLKEMCCYKKDDLKHRRRIQLVKTKDLKPILIPSFLFQKLPKEEKENMDIARLMIQKRSLRYYCGRLDPESVVYTQLRDFLFRSRHPCKFSKETWNIKKIERIWNPGSELAFETLLRSEAFAFENRKEKEKETEEYCYSNLKVMFHGFSGSVSQSIARSNLSMAFRSGGNQWGPSLYLSTSADHALKFTSDTDPWILIAFVNTGMEYDLDSSESSFKLPFLLGENRILVDSLMKREDASTTFTNFKFYNIAVTNPSRILPLAFVNFTISQNKTEVD